MKVNTFECLEIKVLGNSQSEEVHNFKNRQHRNASEKSKKPAHITQEIDDPESPHSAHRIDVFDGILKRKVRKVVEPRRIGSQIDASL